MLRTYYKNAGIVAVSELILRLRSFLLIPLITRAFGPTDYGVWSQVALIAVTLAPIIALGTNPAALRFLPGLPFDEQKRKFSAWVIFLSLIMVTSGIPIILGSRQIASIFFGEEGDFARFIPLAVLMVAFNLILDSMRTWYRVQKNALVVSLIDISRAMLYILAVLLMFTRNETVYELVIYTILADFFALIVAIFFYTVKTGWEAPDFSIIKPLLKFGIPLIPTGLAVWALNYSDRLIIVHTMDLSSLGIYSVAYSLGSMVIELFAKPLRMMLHPSLAELYNQGKIESLSRLFNYSVFSLALLCIPSIVGLYVLGEIVISEISTASFVEGGGIIFLVALAYFLFKIAGNYGFIIGLVKKPWLQSFSTVSAVFVNVGLNLFLIPRMGISGAAIATLAAFSVNLLISFWIATREKLVEIDGGLIWRILLSALLMGIALAYLVNSFVYFSVGGIPGITAAILSGALIYIALLIGLGVLTKERMALAKLIMSRE